MENSIDRLLSLMECECGRRFSYGALFSMNEINFCEKCGRKKPKYLNEELAKNFICEKSYNEIYRELFTAYEAKMLQEIEQKSNPR